MFKREKTYKVGKNQHDGLVKEIRYGSLPESQDRQQDISEEEKREKAATELAMLLNQYQEFLNRKEQQNIGLVLPEQSEQWDLKQLIPNLAKQYFSSYLAGLGLPSEFNKHYLRGKSGMTAFYRFKRLVGLRANKAKLPDKKLMSVDIALSGLEKLSQAQINAAAGRYQQAAIFIGQAMPGAVILQTMVMEQQWRNGEGFNTEAQQEKARKVRKPDRKQLWLKLARLKLSTGNIAKDIWSSIKDILDESFENVQVHEPNQYNHYSWFITYDVTSNEASTDKPKQVTIPYKTFENELSKAVQEITKK